MPINLTVQREGKAALSAKANKYVKETVASATSQAYAYASLKFQATAQPAVGCQPIFRASEMLLIEAEANYYLSSDPTAAQNSLVELNKNSGRDPQYTCTATGEDLLKEIKKYRRLELWGEGFSWYDCKRWGDPVVRNSLRKAVITVRILAEHSDLKIATMYRSSGNGFFRTVKAIITALSK